MALLGIDELISVLIELGSKFASVEVPQSYIFLEGRLRLSRLQQQVMYYKDFCNFVKDCGVPEKKLRHCLEFMNDAGVIVHFDDITCGLNDLVILDPQWIIDLLASVITLKHSYAKDGASGLILGWELTNILLLCLGILPIESLPQIWREYPREQYEWLLRLLEKFEISFRVDPVVAAASGITRTRSTSDGIQPSTLSPSSKTSNFCTPLAEVKTMTLTPPEDKSAARTTVDDMVLPRSSSAETMNMRSGLKRNSNPDMLSTLTEHRPALPDSKAITALDLPVLDMRAPGLFRGRKRSSSDSDSVETSNPEEREKAKTLRLARQSPVRPCFCSKEAGTYLLAHCLTFRN